MGWLLNFIYFAILVIASPWFVCQAIRTGKYRHGFRAKFFGDIPTRSGDGACVWLHAVSVGEVNLLDGVISELRRRRPDLEFAITTTTQSGYALAKQKYRDHLVHYCPLDFTWAVNRAYTCLRPELLVLVELELWPNLIASAHRRGIPVAVMNGRLSEASYRGYRRIRRFTGRVLQQLTTVAVQNETFGNRFIELGAPSQNVAVTGSIKFDNANTDRNNPHTASLRNLVGLTADHAVLIAGSTQDPEEALSLETFQELYRRYPQLRLMVVPRHPERFDEVDQVLSNSGCRYVRRSQIKEPISAKDWQVMLVDTVGELGAWWGTATIAFVGGSMGDRGGQNMIEPAAYGAAVCFGPNTRNFRDVVSMLLSRNAAVVVPDGNGLTQFVDQCLANSQFAKSMGTRARSLVVEQCGAIEKTVDILVSQLPPHPPIPQPLVPHAVKNSQGLRSRRAS